jgi:hypothetical protein
VCAPSLGALRNLTTKMNCRGLEWTRLSVKPQLGTVLEKGHRFICNMCVDIESFVTWMMKLTKFHWIVMTWVSRTLALEDCMVLI